MSKSVPFTVYMTKIRYCEFNKNRCARYKLLQVFEIGQIPDTLWPSDGMKAIELIESRLIEKRQKLYGCTVEEIPA